MCTISIDTKDNRHILGNLYATVFNVRFCFSFKVGDRLEERTRAIAFLVTSKNGVPLRDPDVKKQWWNPESLIPDLRDNKIMVLAHGFIWYLVRDVTEKLDSLTPVYYEFMPVMNNDQLRGIYMRAEKLCNSTNRGYQHHATVEHVGPQYHEEYDIWIFNGDTTKFADTPKTNKALSDDN